MELWQTRTVKELHNRCMKPLQSLFSLVSRLARLLAASPLARDSCSTTFSLRIFEQKRDSDTCSTTFSLRIFEQKRDCSQSISNQTIKKLSLACEQAPVGRAERELGSSEVARGSGGACGQRLYASVLCTWFRCNLQLVGSLIVDRFDWRLHFTDAIQSKFAYHIWHDRLDVKTWPFFWRWAAHRRSVWKSTERFAQGFHPYDTAERRTKTLLAISGRKKGCFRNPSHSIPIQSRLIAVTRRMQWLRVENECKRRTACTELTLLEAQVNYFLQNR